MQYVFKYISAISQNLLACLNHAAYWKHAVK